MRKFWKRVGVGLLLGVAGLWANNSSVLVRDTANHETQLLAHRGVHQIYVGSDRSADSCHASPIAPVSHEFIANTIPSMRAAFALGADVVELDVHLTADGQFAVFHDWTLDCRTDGTGVTRKQKMEALRALDLGYGLDPGDGTYPLRGLGVGMMPTLQDVFASDLGGQFLINFKSRDKREGEALARLLEVPEARAQVFGVYGGEPPTREAMRLLPGMRGYDRAGVKDCLLRYAAFGWSGYVPEACRDGVMVVPQNFAPFLWGWPHRLTKRMDAKGTIVLLLGPYDGSGFSSGVDSVEAFAKVPAGFDGFVWTDRVEVLGPLLAEGVK